MKSLSSLAKFYFLSIFTKAIKLWWIFIIFRAYSNQQFFGVQLIVNWKRVRLLLHSIPLHVEMACSPHSSLSGLVVGKAEDQSLCHQGRLSLNILHNSSQLSSSFLIAINLQKTLVQSSEIFIIQMERVLILLLRGSLSANELVSHSSRGSSQVNNQPGLKS